MIFSLLSWILPILATLLLIRTIHNIDKRIMKLEEFKNAFMARWANMNAEESVEEMRNFGKEIRNRKTGDIGP